jgi:predicted DNA-binding transcriptional regulator
MEILIFRKKINSILQIKKNDISIYKISSEKFEKTSEESTGYTWHTTKPTNVIEEIQYLTVLDALREKNVKVNFI